jgi:hypothetical protein
VERALPSLTISPVVIFPQVGAILCSVNGELLLCTGMEREAEENKKGGRLQTQMRWIFSLWEFMVYSFNKMQNIL